MLQKTNRFIIMLSICACIFGWFFFIFSDGTKYLKRVSRHYTLLNNLIMESRYTSNSTKNEIGSKRMYGQHLVNCILKENPDEYYTKLPNLIKSCTKKFSNITLDHFTELTRAAYKEMKRFVLPEHFGDQWHPACIWMTIGIGGDTGVEKEFLKRFPRRCKIYGIEANPIPMNVKDFATLGVLIPKAVGAKDQTVEIKVRTDQNKWGYKTEAMRVHSLTKILEQYVHSRTIHLATMDIEGSEYDLLEGFKATTDTLLREGVHICQLDVEIHNPTFKSKTFNFGRYIEGLLRNSVFVPIHGEHHLGEHHKIVFIDASGHSECENMFNLSAYFK